MIFINSFNLILFSEHLSPQNHQNTSISNFSTDSILGLSNCSEPFNLSDSSTSHRDDSGFDLSNTLDLSVISSVSSGKSTDPHISSSDTQYKESLFKSLKKTNDKLIEQKVLSTKESATKLINFSNSENDAGLLIIAPQHKQRNNALKSTETGLEILQKNSKG